MGSTNSSAVPSVGDSDWHNSQGSPSLLIESFWHPCSLINTPQGSHRP